MHRIGVTLSNSNDGEIEIKSNNGYIEIKQASNSIYMSDIIDIDVFVEELLSIAENIKGSSNE